MILCETERNPLEYVGYGCYCGRGKGVGNPVDEIDWCCVTHDKCYDDIRSADVCGENIGDALHRITYERNGGCTGCAREKRFFLDVGNSGCQKAKCECDGAAARCFQQHDSKFNTQFIKYDKSSC
ncbi:Phospholipase A2, major isoenzyme [Desmophyllum pertusum]|uniref:phospholipase A2 n=1 Tax=Desmophyllum pertusum TaxID=174260 RepID=A0A9W9YFA4_9CNID|nr:Phospholipase A2, major isoenzyme [Desmophyllum pertusum]